MYEEPAIRLGVFRDSTTEAAYRAFERPTERRWVTSLFVTSWIVNALLVPNDVTLAAPRWLPFVLGARVGASLLLAVLLPRVRRAADARTFDGLLTLAISAMIGVLLLANASRPPSYSHHVFVDLVVLAAINLSMPVSVTRLSLISIAFFAIELVVLQTFRVGQTRPMLVAISSSFLLLGAFTLSVTARVRTIQRRAFVVMRARERERDELASALEQLRALRGLLGMCAWCKRVRDESGRWRALHDLVHDQKDALISHGMCEACAREMDAELSR